MNDPALDSMLLASTNPERLGEWYVAALDPDEDTKVEGYRVLKFGHVHLLIDQRDDIGDTNPDPARLILNFDVADARAVAVRMDSLGTTWLAALEDRDGSLFGTAIDPDGNYVQIIQLSTAHRAEMRRQPGEPLLASSPAFSTFSVDDLQAAEEFYGHTLGLSVSTSGGLLTLHLPGGRDVIVYPKLHHTPGSFTVLHFPVADIEAAVDELGASGVRFEHYSDFEQDARGIDRSGAGPLVAWFTDPAGNVLSILQEGSPPPTRRGR